MLIQLCAHYNNKGMSTSSQNKHKQESERSKAFQFTISDSLKFEIFV